MSLFTVFRMEISEIVYRKICKDYVSRYSEQLNTGTDSRGIEIKNWYGKIYEISCCLPYWKIRKKVREVILESLRFSVLDGIKYGYGYPYEKKLKTASRRY